MLRFVCMAVVVGGTNTNHTEKKLSACNLQYFAGGRNTCKGANDDQWKFIAHYTEHI